MENTVFDIRINNLKKRIAAHEDIYDILIFKEEDIFYLSGFFGKYSNSVLLLTENKNYLFVNFIYIEDAKNSVKTKDIEIILYDQDKNELMREILKSNNVDKILIQSDCISYSNYIKMEKEFKKAKIKSISIENPVEILRAVKDESEQELIRNACKLTDRSFELVCDIRYKDFLKYSELELSIEIEKFLISFGGKGRSFDYVVANNSNSSKPHYSSENLKITKGLLLMDYGVVFGNYCSDITRTIFIGKKLHAELKKIYEIVKEAQQISVDYCKEGIMASELDSIARKFIISKGYGANFGHSLGHGVGIEIHEPPWINSKNDEILKKGMVVTIEPGIYVEGLGGVRIEDMVIVGEKGCENLYSSTREIIRIN
ncbi:MAG: Xaa-Pro peptidase family protein [Actinomycetota bacterium]|nr:Xaa-Pro peptidase family protein [Actinomycetota bacterium]